MSRRRHPLPWVRYRENWHLYSSQQMPPLHVRIAIRAVVEPMRAVAWACRGLARFLGGEQ